MIIAEIQYINFPQGIIQKDGYLDILKAGTIGVSGLDHYIEASSLARLKYAKPDQSPSELDD